MKIKYPMDIKQIGGQTRITLGNTEMCTHRLAYPPLRLYTPYRRINEIHIAHTKEMKALYIPGCYGA